MRSRFYLLARSLLKSFFLCAFIALNVAAHADNTRIVATVGVQLISEGDLVRKQSMQRCYGDSAATPAQCFMMLANEALERDVLRAAYNLEPPHAALIEKLGWIEKNTHDPQTLECIRRSFGADTSQFLRLFVSPLLVNLKLHQSFRADTMKNTAARDSIKYFWSLVKSNTAALTTLPHDTISFPKKSPTTSIAGASSEAATTIVDSIISKLSIGQVWNAIIEDDNAFMIIRLDSISTDAYHTTRIVVAKRPFDDWFREFTRANCPVNCIDANLERDVRKNYPTLWWFQ